MDRHDLDPISLIFGLAFIALGLLSLAGLINPAVLGWTLPLVAIGLGIALALTARRNAKRAHPPTTDLDGPI
ncbi:MAG: hypothetical protein ACRD0K_04160 [Egibacteraceae bacterium]